MAPSLIMAPYLSTSGLPTSLPVGSALSVTYVYVVKSSARTPLRGAWRHVAAARCDRVSLRRAAGPHALHGRRGPRCVLCVARSRRDEGGWPARIAAAAATASQPHRRSTSNAWARSGGPVNSHRRRAWPGAPARRRRCVNWASWLKRHWHCTQQAPAARSRAPTSWGRRARPSSPI